MIRLDDLLTELGEAARSADFASLEAISAKLETISFPTDQIVLQRAARLAAENRIFLEAAAQGLRAAHRRLTDLSDARRLQTYDGSGRKLDNTAPQGKPRRL